MAPRWRSPRSIRVGGTCVIRGCVPKKLLVYASRFADAFEDAVGFGWTTAGVRFDWPTLIANKDRGDRPPRGCLQRTLETPASELFASRAVLRDAPHASCSRPTAERHRPLCPDRHRGDAASAAARLPGVEHAITSNEAFHLGQLPESHHDRRRRLHRGGVRRHLQWPRHPRRHSSTAARRSCAVSTTISGAASAKGWRGAASR